MKWNAGPRKGRRGFGVFVIWEEGEYGKVALIAEASDWGIAGPLGPKMKAEVEMSLRRATEVEWIACPSPVHMKMKLKEILDTHHPYFNNVRGDNTPADAMVEDLKYKGIALFDYFNCDYSL